MNNKFKYQHKTMVHKPTDLYSQLIDFVTEHGVNFIVFSALTGISLGWLIHYIFNVRPLRRAQRREAEQQEEEEAERKETSKILTSDEVKEMLLKGKGRINSSIFKKNRVAFNPKVEESRVTDYTEDSANEVDDDFEEEISHNDPSSSCRLEENEEEEQMPQINNRRVMSSTTKRVQLPDEDRPIDSDRISQVLGNLHGKLATAQLKAKTKQLTAEMSAEERDYEAKMKAKQMESIMALMMQNKEKFGMSSKEDIQEQLNLYNF